MKKETYLFVAIALAAGILIGLLVSNLRDKPVAKVSQSSAPVSGTPVVNQQQQTAILEGIVAKEPNNRNAWVTLGHSYFDSNQPMKAIDAYAKALELFGDDPDILTDQGIMYRRVGWFDKAVENFIKAGEIDKNHQQSLYNLGIVYRYDLQDFTKAIEAWERFIAINPETPGAAQVRAELDFMRKHPKMPTQPMQPQ